MTTTIEAQSVIGDNKVPVGNTNSEKSSVEMDKNALESAEPKEDRVPYSKYREILAEKKAMQEDKMRIESKLKAYEDEKLKEQSRWKELYETKENELKSLRDQAENERKAFIESQKMSVILNELGGLKNEKYSTFIDTSKVIYSDGSIDRTTLSAYIEDFKREHPDLLKQREKVPTPPSVAPKSNSAEDLSKLSFSELTKILNRQ